MTVKAVLNSTSRFLVRLFREIRGGSAAMAPVVSVAENEVYVHTPRMITRLILRGTLIVVVMLFILLLVSYFFGGNEQVLARIWIGVGIIGYLCVGLILFRFGRYKATAWLLVSLYLFLASTILALWSINTAIGILILGSVIVLAGVMLGSRYIILFTVVAIVLLLCVQGATMSGVVTPDTSSLSKPSELGDAIGYSIIFGVLALVSWLSQRQMERSLQQALRAEYALEREKGLLAVRLEERTRDLKASQIEEMRQLYRFAELGQASTAVLHELANHLTVLTLNIDDLQQRHRRSEEITQAKESIEYIEDMITQVRRQIKNTHHHSTFSSTRTLHETIKSLEAKAQREGVSFVVKTQNVDSKVSLKGDPVQFSQVISILVTNAIESYRTQETLEQKKVEIVLESHKRYLLLRVIDQGKGITTSQRKTLFLPHSSHKKNGMGIGLFLAKQIIEVHFSGKISFSSTNKKTIFSMKLPTSTKIV